MTVEAKTDVIEDEYEEYDEFDEEENERGLSGLVVLLMGLVMLGAFASVVWIAYQQGLKNANASTEPPTIVADPEPVKIENQVAEAADQPTVYDRLDGVAETAETIAAGPEEPIARGDENPIAGVAEPAPGAEGAPGVVDDAVADRITALAQADTAAEETAAPPATTPPPQPAEARPEPAPTPPPAAAASSGEALSGSHVVQVGAFKSQAEATANWTALQTKLGDYVDGKGDDVERADLGAKGVFYRLRIGPFASSAEARTYCEGLKSRGQDCMVRTK